MRSLLSHPQEVDLSPPGQSCLVLSLWAIVHLAEIWALENDSWVGEVNAMATRMNGNHLPVRCSNEGLPLSDGSGYFGGHPEVG